MGRILNFNVANYLVHDSVNLGLNGLTECSVAAWVKQTAGHATFQGICTKQQQSTPTNEGTAGLIVINAGSNVQGFIENAAFTQTPFWQTTTSLSVGVWTRILFTWKRNAITVADGKIYFNGVSQALALTANGYAADFALGENTNRLLYGILEGLNNPADAAVEWITYWNRQLTPEEAVADFQNPRNILRGRVSCVEICPDEDLELGGSMTVVGSCPCDPGPNLQGFNLDDGGTSIQVSRRAA